MRTATAEGFKPTTTRTNEPEPEREIHAALREVDYQAQDVEREIERLASRAGPVCAVSPPELRQELDTNDVLAKDKDGRPYSAALAQEISALGKRFQVSTALLRSVTDSIQL